MPNRTPKWTPGPWRITEHRDALDAPTHYGIAAGGKIPYSYPSGTHGETDEIDVVEVSCYRDYNYPEGGIVNPADAHLIVAAQDLYAAVMAALNMVDGDGAPPDWDMLRAAAKKARGESDAA